jgi:hypothetical protein
MILRYLLFRKDQQMMMVEAEATARQLVEQFVEALRALPEVRADLQPGSWVTSGPDPGYDAKVDLWVASKSVTLLVEAKKSLYPRDARQLLWRLKEFRNRWAHGSTKEIIPLLLAVSISPGAKELLKEERVGYFDSGGSLYVPAEGAYLYVEKPPPKSLMKSMRSLFSGRRSQVLHALLMRRTEWFGVKELATLAEVSSATASQVLTDLDRSEWLESRGQGPNKERHLREPTALLDGWTKQLATMRAPFMRRYYVSSVRTEELMQRLDQVCAARGAEYAITHEVAGQRYAPFLSNIAQVRARLLAGPAAEQAIGDLDARVVNEGANLFVIDVKTSGELLFRERVDGAWLASPVQVYLDLMRSEGRSKELAQHVREERIGF